MSHVYASEMELVLSDKIIILDINVKMVEMGRPINDRDAIAFQDSRWEKAQLIKVVRKMHCPAKKSCISAENLIIALLLAESVNISV